MMLFSISFMTSWWKTHHVIWGALLDYGRIEWQKTLKDIDRAPNVAYDERI